MELSDIFELIVKADEKLKYATAGKGDVRAKQAGELLSEALREAAAIGNDALSSKRRFVSPISTRSSVDGRAIPIPAAPSPPRSVAPFGRLRGPPGRETERKVRPVGPGRRERHPRASA